MSERLADAVLPGLKPFQRATVEHAFDRLYDANGSGRFLVADEVGLGKTLVARGVIAKTIDRLRDEGVRRIDVIYVCSNQVIARQNISKLNVLGAEHDAVLDRVTMLPAHLKDLDSNEVNLIPLTPQTSLDLRSNVGAARERALLWYLLRSTLGGEYMNQPGPRRVLQGPCKNLPSFNWYLQNAIEDPRSLNSGLRWQFVNDLKEDRRINGRNSLIARFRRIATEFEGKRREPFVQEANWLVGDLRRRLARSCIGALEADLIILDEFQRFRNLLDAKDNNSDLAQLLFSQKSAKVLMLSATPYKMLTQSVDPAEDHHQDFLATLRFLFGEDGAGVDTCRGALGDLRAGLRDLDSEEGQARARSAKAALEGELRTVMSRTERLATGADRNGMVKAVESHMEMGADDVRGFAELDRIAQQIKHSDITEYWKSSPYPLNFMDGYLLARGYEEGAAKDPNLRPKAGALDFKRWREFKRLDMANPKMRALARDTVDEGLWKLLWIPPSLPYYRAGKPFSEVDADAATKRLIFSAWAVVPKAISCLLSYEAERRLVGVDGPVDRENSQEARAAISSPLRIARGPNGQTAETMTTFAFLYPSVALARIVDPLRLAQEQGTERPVEATLRHAERLLRPRVEQLTRKHRGKGRDTGWYAAAALLLDAQEDEGNPADWLAADSTRTAIGGRRDAGYRDSAWGLHLDRAHEILGGGELGAPPEDLVRVLALLALGSPAVCTVRALQRVAPGASASVVRDAALSVADGLRGTYSQPEIQPLIKATDPSTRFWEDGLRYGCNGNLQAVMDEYSHVLSEWAPIEGDKTPDDVVRGVGGTMAEALSLRAPDYQVRDIGRDGIPMEEPVHMRSRFALPFGDGRSTEDEKQVVRAGAVRTAFNSPFWPFVLSTTSVGQEGLDFHLYSHAIVHWNLPSNPVDFEQREGRVHRYKCHAVRRNVAAAHGAAAIGSGANEPWAQAFDQAQSEDGDEAGLVPFWIYDDGPAKILRSVPVLPWSRDVQRQARLERMLGAYRLTFGQPRQDELLALLDAKSIDRDTIDSLLVDLRP